jgi:hypothetical protein
MNYIYELGAVQPAPNFGVQEPVFNNMVCP